MPRRPRVHRLEGVIKHYPWGSRHVLAALQGRSTPSEQPEAELWLGAHPSGPAQVEVEGAWAPLDELIRADPEYWLGPEALARHGPRLPFLMKVLAVEQPLSLQAHPDAQRAASIFEQERHLSAAERRYTDPYAKPELVCALTRFEALCGVRSEDEIREWLAAAGLGDLMDSSAVGSAAVHDFLARWLRLSSVRRRPQIEDLLAAARRRAAEDPISRRILDLAVHWPGDPGLVAPVLLHEIALEPGEALFLPAGVLHCYLSGAAIEVMAASDNVVRAGLTNKPIHVGELLEIACFEEGPPELLRGADSGSSYGGHRTPCHEFRLTRSRISPDGRLEVAVHGPMIVLCTGGRLRVEANGHALELARGAAVAIPAALEICEISGDGEGAWTALPDASPRG